MIRTLRAYEACSHPTCPASVNATHVNHKTEVTLAEQLQNRIPNRLLAYPANRVVGIIADPDRLQAALDALSSSGFDVNKIDVICGEQGSHRIEQGTSSSRLGKLLRTVHTLSKGKGHVNQYEKALLTGHYLISVPAQGPGAKTQIRALLKSHGGYFINYYGRRTVEPLEA